MLPACYFRQRKINNDPYINQFDQPKVIYTGNKSDFKSH